MIIPVEVSGVIDPLPDDLIALYSPADVDPSQTSPIKFKSAKTFGSDYLSTGNGTVTFQVVNLHTDFRFVFMRNASSNGDGDNWIQFNDTVVAAKSERLQFSNPHEPLQGHISLTGRAGEMRFVWASGNTPLLQRLKLGTSSGKYSSTWGAKAYTYKASGEFSSFSNESLFRFHQFFHF